MALHEQCVGASDEWYTPPEVFDALGKRFRMDVSAPGPHVAAVLDPRSWIPADIFITSDSLAAQWEDDLWMNAPFGGRNGLWPWLEKFFDHGRGIALVPDRTSAPWFQAFVRRADAFLFTNGKLKFIGPDGKRGVSPAQGTCLVALGAENVAALHRAERLNFGFVGSRPTQTALETKT